MTDPSISGVIRRPIDVIVVDDDRDTREMMRALFEMQRWVVRDFADAASALASAMERPPHVLVSDHQLGGGLDGARLARAVRSAHETRDVGLLLITGHDAGPAITRAFDAHLRKPAPVERVIELVQRLAPVRLADLDHRAN